jgi:hypothetical protein
MQLDLLKCGACGANLKVGPGQVLAHCPYCRAGYEIIGSNAVRFEQSAIDLTHGGKAGLWLPFWLVEFDVRVREMESTQPLSVFGVREETLDQRGRECYLDLYHRVVERGNTLLVTAFKASNFINYSADLSAALSRHWDSPALITPKTDMDWSKCYYDHLDARQTALVLLRLLINRDVKEIVELEFDPVWKRHRLVWWPFAPDGDCWKDMVYGQRVLKSALEPAQARSNG